MENLKYLAYAVPSCMALAGTKDAIEVSFVTTIILTAAFFIWEKMK